MKIGVTGATGLIGTRLCEELAREGHSLLLFSRRQIASASTIPWDSSQRSLPKEHVSELDAVVHLAGEPIAGGRWTRHRKQLIWDSRVAGTRNLVDSFGELGVAPKVFLCSSAVGYYGNRGSEVLDEQSPPGKGFLAELSEAWEREALRIEALGTRVVLLRTGMVLSTAGGALPKMMTPFRFFAGGWLGNGMQYMSWIHEQDVTGILRFALEEKAVSGPLNVTAPNPVSNLEFSRTLGRVLGRPAISAVPGFVLRALYGEMAEELLLEGQRVVPRKVLDLGYTFSYLVLEEALSDLLGRAAN